MLLVLRLFFFVIGGVLIFFGHYLFFVFDEWFLVGVFISPVDYSGESNNSINCYISLGIYSLNVF